MALGIFVFFFLLFSFSLSMVKKGGKGAQRGLEFCG